MMQFEHLLTDTTCLNISASSRDFFKIPSKLAKGAHVLKLTLSKDERGTPGIFSHWTASWPLDMIT